MTLARRACRMLAIGLLAALHAFGADAAAIVHRGALHTLLGDDRTVEQFQAYSILPNVADALDCPTLTSASVCNGQGPGLVQPGLTFSSPTQLQWNGLGYYGSGAPAIVGRTSLTIDFATAPTAFGVDLWIKGGVQFSGISHEIAQVHVYAADDTTLLAQMVIPIGPGSTQGFAGWQDAGGIGKIDLFPTVEFSTPMLSWLEYTAVATTDTPEPASAALLGLGLAALALRRRMPRGA